MHEQILKLAIGLSQETGAKIADLDQIMLKTHMLSVNARLEAARAGDAGKSFAVVAREMGMVAQEVNALSTKLNATIAENVCRIRDAGHAMNLEFRGNRLAALARNSVEIIDRNLYERSCDVRWWATDSAVVDALENPSATTAAYASSRLATILRSYTVYLDLWIADQTGRVVAHGRPDRYPGLVGSRVDGTEWFRRGLSCTDGDSFVVCDIQTNPGLDEAAVATYATAIRSQGAVQGRPLGVLGIFFDWTPQAQDIVCGVSLSEEERSAAQVMLLDAQHRIIASSTPFRPGERFPLQVNGPWGHYQQDNRLIAYGLTPGYETYRGLGWYGCIAMSQDPTTLQ